MPTFLYDNQQKTDGTDIWLVPVYISLNQEVKEQIREAKLFIYFIAICFN